MQLGNAPCPDNQINQMVVPPAPAVASAAYGTELIEMYWASLLRDVAFTDYASNPIAGASGGGADNSAHLRRPERWLRSASRPICYFGPLSRRYPWALSFAVLYPPTFFGVQPISQQMVTFLPNIDYMTDPVTFQQVQNGINTGQTLQLDPQLRYLHDGRGLGSYTHADVLFQAYFAAYLVLGSIGRPVNPGNPYAHSTKQNGFGTFGGPDFAATLPQLRDAPSIMFGIKNGGSTFAIVPSRVARSFDKF